MTDTEMITMNFGFQTSVPFPTVQRLETRTPRSFSECKKEFALMTGACGAQS